MRIWVALDSDNSVVGSYGINMHAVHVQDMPERFQKRAGKHGQLPAAFITMIGIDKEQQGKGLGSALLADALDRIVRISVEIGTCVIMLDVLDDGDARSVTRRKVYYEAFGFISLPGQPLRLFMPVETARKVSGCDRLD